MGLWNDRVLPRVVDRSLSAPEVAPLRAAVCGGLRGRVLEIGFGSGLNVPHYPPAVQRVDAVEPSDVGWRLAGPRLTASPVPVQRGGLDGQALPFADDSFDAALSTFSLCTIPDAGAALREVHRVLRPGGALHFLEHGRAPDPGVRRWQDRLVGLNSLVQGGCRMNRPIDELLTAAGFTLERLERGYVPKAPRMFAALYEGRARR